MPDYLDKFTEKKKDGTLIQSVPIRDSDAQERLATVEGKLTTDTTSASGNPLSITGLKSTQNAINPVITLEPIQDLHGQDKPWVGGAGKNLLPMTVEDIKAENTDGTWSGNDYTYRGITWSILTDSDNNVIGIGANGTCNSSLHSQIVIPLLNKVEDGDYYFYGCAIGGGSRYYIYSYDTTASARPTKWDGTTLSKESTRPDDNEEIKIIQNDNISIRCRVTNNSTVSNIVFTPMLVKGTETDFTFEPYTNECGISGRTEVSLLGCGKNIAKPYVYNYTGTISYDYDGTGKATLNGTPSSTGGSPSTSTAISNGYAFYLPAGTYIPSISDTDAGIDVINTDNNSFLSQGAKFTITEGCNAFVRVRAIKNTQYSNKEYFLQLENGEDATTYEPYKQSNDITLNFGQTVYGGSLDVETGLLTVKYGIVDLGDLEWQYQSQYTRFRAPFTLAKNSATTESVANIVCTIYPAGSMDEARLTDNPCIAIGTADYDYIYTQDRRYKDATTYGNAINGAILCYELDQYTTIQLTPHAISILKGANNFSTDGDNITLTFRSGEFATLGDLEVSKAETDVKIAESQILTDTETGKKYKLVVANGVLDIEEIIE